MQDSKILKRSILAAVLALWGCDQRTSDIAAPHAAAAASTAPVVKVARPVSMDEWKSALLSTYNESDTKDKGDGITESTANFHKHNGKEGVLMLTFAKRDAFRKLRFYTFFGSSVLDIADVHTFIKIYISVPDGKKAVFFMRPTYNGKRGWLFMNKVAIMVDGEVVLEKKFPSLEAKRDVEDGYVHEEDSFIADADEISALRKITEKSTVLIRLTGDKGFVNVDKQGVDFFKSDVIDGLYVYDAINEAVESHLPPSTD